MIYNWQHRKAMENPGALTTYDTHYDMRVGSLFYERPKKKVY